MLGFSFFFLRLLKNRFQFCSRTASVSGFQFWFKFRPRKLFYFEYGLFKCSTFWRFCFFTMISSTSDGQVKRAVASDVVDLGTIPSPVKPMTQKLVFTASLFLTLSFKETVEVMMVMIIFKTQNLTKF